MSQNKYQRSLTFSGEASVSFLSLCLNSELIGLLKEKAWVGGIAE